MSNALTHTAPTAPAPRATITNCDYARIGAAYLQAVQDDHTAMCRAILAAGKGAALAVIARATIDPLAVEPGTLSAIREIFGLTVNIDRAYKNLRAQFCA